MGHFSNGTEGMMYEEAWCDRCRFNADEDNACPVMIAHLLYDYDLSQDKEHPGKVILDLLIPIGEDGFNEQCRMFAEEPEDNQLDMFA